MDSKLAFYIVKRFLLAIVTIFLVITITFFAMNAIPGGPFLKEKALTPEALATLNAKYGLDKPLGVQYITYLSDVLHFDFGPSLKQRRYVVDLIFSGFKTSATVGGIAALLAIVCGITLGSIAAIKRNKVTDKLIMIFSTGFVATPSFIIATVLLITLCVNPFQLFPARGDTFEGLILPIVALSLYPMSYITRLTRSSMLEVLGQDYIRTARAKGVPAVKVIFKHALKNALIPVLTYVGPMTAYILTGSLVIEKIFSVPGLGRAFVKSITDRDYTLIMGTTIFLASLIIIMNLLTDIFYKLVDPRIDFS